MKSIYDLKLHEREWRGLGVDKDIMRVPGGWIYSDYDPVKDVWINPIFVPFIIDLQDKAERE